MKKVLDACCGSRMFYYNRQNKNVLFMDKREITTEQMYVIMKALQ